MREYLKEFLEETEKLSKGKVTKEDLDNLYKKITFFQHERFIHLIVSMFCTLFAILFMMLCFKNSLFLIPTLVLLIMVTFYILHY